VHHNTAVVTGGSGDYAGAQGEVTLVETEITSSPGTSQSTYVTTFKLLQALFK
jgi:hypothetical protein